MSKVSWEHNSIYFNGRKILLDNDILEVRELADMVLVVTIPKVGNIDNLFGISINTGDMWKVQSLKEVYPEFSQTPYVGVSVIDNEILVIDFSGCRFKVNPMNGKIEGRAYAVK